MSDETELFIKQDKLKKKVKLHFRDWERHEADNYLERMKDDLRYDGKEAIIESFITDVIENGDFEEIDVEQIEKILTAYILDRGAERDFLEVEWHSVLVRKETELTSATLDKHFPIPKMYEDKLQELYGTFLLGLMRWENENQIADDRSTYLKPFLEKKAMEKSVNPTL